MENNNNKKKIKIEISKTDTPLARKNIQEDILEVALFNDENSYDYRNIDENDENEKFYFNKERKVFVFNFIKSEDEEKFHSNGNCLSLTLLKNETKILNKNETTANLEKKPAKEEEEENNDENSSRSSNSEMVRRSEDHPFNPPNPNYINPNNAEVLPVPVPVTFNPITINNKSSYVSNNYLEVNLLEYSGLFFQRKIFIPSGSVIEFSSKIDENEIINITLDKDLYIYKKNTNLTIFIFSLIFLTILSPIFYIFRKRFLQNKEILEEENRL